MCAITDVECSSIESLIINTSFSDFLKSYKYVASDDIEDDINVYNADISDTLSDSIFCSGWYGIEEAGDVKFRWSKPKSLINFTGLEGYSVDLVLSTANPFLSIHPVKLFLTDYNTKEFIGELTFGGEEKALAVHLDIQNNNTIIMLNCSSSWVPGVLYDDSEDYRDLSFAVEGEPKITKPN